jgi:hypothetical protein
MRIVFAGALAASLYLMASFDGVGAASRLGMQDGWHTKKIALQCRRYCSFLRLYDFEVILN